MAAVNCPGATVSTDVAALVCKYVSVICPFAPDGATNGTWIAAFLLVSSAPPVVPATNSALIAAGGARPSPCNAVQSLIPATAGQMMEVG